MATHSPPATAQSKGTPKKVRSNHLDEPPEELISDSVVAVTRRADARLSAEQHHDLIKVTAYYLSERRNFEPGHEQDDWLAAEILVMSRAGAPVTYRAR
jgi:DUF2934 family protein